jgi:carbonic anhydrase
VKKLLAGIRDFHERVRPAYRERFAHLALDQSPDCLFIACSDSRVVPNLFASTDPGDLFVVRNVGNIVPPAGGPGGVEGDGSAGAAVEFAALNLGVADIVVCGHSSCGAMRATLSNGVAPEAPHLGRWLEHTKDSVRRLEREETLGAGLPMVDRLSQAHVLQQIENLRTYPSVAKGVAEGKVTLRAWWFDLANAEVLAYDPGAGAFVPLVGLLGP